MMRLASPDGSQEFSARIGRVTGIGIAANLRKNYPSPLHDGVLFVVAIANVFNLGADIGAMGSAWKERPLYFDIRRLVRSPEFRWSLLRSIRNIEIAYPPVRIWGKNLHCHVHWAAIAHSRLLPARRCQKCSGSRLKVFASRLQVTILRLRQTYVVHNATKVGGV
jgi:hypothetical protein